MAYGPKFTFSYRNNPFKPDILIGSEGAWFRGVSLYSSIYVSFFNLKSICKLHSSKGAKRKITNSVHCCYLKYFAGLLM